MWLPIEQISTNCDHISITYFIFDSIKMDNTTDAIVMEDSELDQQQRKTDKMEEAIENLNMKKRNTPLNADLIKLDTKRHLLHKMQYKHVFHRFLPPDEITIFEGHLTEEDEEFPEIAEEECNVKEIAPELPEDEWHGFFTGFRILREDDEFKMCENKKCVEITPHSSAEVLETFIRKLKIYTYKLFTHGVRLNRTERFFGFFEM